MDSVPGHYSEGAAHSDSWDAVLRAAAATAAMRIVPLEDELEIGEQKHLVPALAEAFRLLVGPERVAVGKKIQTSDWLPDWNPLPGNVDVVVGSAPNPLMSPQAGIEAKSRTHSGKLGETIWDIFKMSSLTRMRGVKAAYVVMAAPADKFTSSERGAALFDAPLRESVEWHSSYPIDEWPAAWQELLDNGTGRPIRVPRSLSLYLVDVHSVPAFPGWEIRTVRVEAQAADQWLVFGSNGWPSHLDPNPWEHGPRQISDASLTLADVPSPDCDEGEIHLFALSCDGYAREGNQQRCATLANTARRWWDDTGELPSGMRALRSCLFFEQRRAHMSGYGFGEVDPRTLDYVRALVEAIRALAPVRPSR